MKLGADEIISRISELSEPVLNGEGLELVEVQYRREGGGWVLRLFVDRQPLPGHSDLPGAEGSGVTLDDCVAVSREMGRILDVEDVIPGGFTLEVSSPGLDRPLTRPADFTRYAGRLVKARIRTPEGRRKLTGRLMGLEGDLIRIDVDGQVLDLPREQVERVQLEPEVAWDRA